MVEVRDFIEQVSQARSHAPDASHVAVAIEGRNMHGPSEIAASTHSIILTAHADALSESMPLYSRGAKGLRTSDHNLGELPDLHQGGYVTLLNPPVCVAPGAMALLGSKELLEHLSTKPNGTTIVTGVHDSDDRAYVGNPSEISQQSGAWATRMGRQSDALRRRGEDLERAHQLITSALCLMDPEDHTRYAMYCRLPHFGVDPRTVFDLYAIGQTCGVNFGAFGRDVGFMK